jgi:hypothetical protein
MAIGFSTLSRLCNIALLATVLAFPQSPTGGIEGLILDPSGETVSNVVISVSEVGTGRRLTQVSNKLGRYSVLHLLPGTYKVTAKAAGFATTELTDIVVEAGAVVNGDIHLTLGIVEETVTVRATVGAVDTARHVVDTVISERDIQTLPVLSRNALDLAVLAPGVTVNDGTLLDPTKANAYRAVGISGRAGSGTRFQIDGIDVTDTLVGSTLINVSMDTVQEFQLTRSSLDPSAPMTSSSAVSIITKRGSNDTHGHAFFDYTNESLSARADYDEALQPFHTTRCGGMAGGPIRKDRLFWLAQTERSWSASRMASINPMWPQLNFRSDSESGVRYTTGRLDSVVSPTVRAFYKFQNASDFNSGGTATSPYRNVDWVSQHVVGMDAGSQRWTHSFRFGFVNFNNRIISDEPPVPFRRTPQGQQYYLSVGSYAFGPYSYAPQSTGEGTVQNNYDGSFFHGRHSLRIGGHVNRIVTANFTGSSYLRVFGTYNATASAQVQTRGGNPLDPTEYALASFNVSAGSLYPKYAGGHGFEHGAQYDTRTSAYILDSVKAARGLTVNIGVRREYDSGYLANDRRVPRDPVVDTWIPGASAYPAMPKDLLAPQLGFAWVPTRAGKTVIRGGFLRAYESNLAENNDELAMLPPIFAGALFTTAFVALPNGAAGYRRQASQRRLYRPGGQANRKRT